MKEQILNFRSSYQFRGFKKFNFRRRDDRRTEKISNLINPNQISNFYNYLLKSASKDRGRILLVVCSGCASGVLEQAKRGYGLGDFVSQGCLESLSAACPVGSSHRELSAGVECFRLELLKAKDKQLCEFCRE